MHHVVTLKLIQDELFLSFESDGQDIGVGANLADHPLLGEAFGWVGTEGENGVSRVNRQHLKLIAVLAVLEGKDVTTGMNGVGGYVVERDVEELSRYGVGKDARAINTAIDKVFPQEGSTQRRKQSKLIRKGRKLTWHADTYFRFEPSREEIEKHLSQDAKERIEFRIFALEKLRNDDDFRRSTVGKIIDQIELTLWRAEAGDARHVVDEAFFGLGELAVVLRLQKEHVDKLLSKEEGLKKQIAPLKIEEIRSESKKAPSSNKTLRMLTRATAVALLLAISTYTIARMVLSRGITREHVADQNRVHAPATTPSPSPEPKTIGLDVSGHFTTPAREGGIIQLAHGAIAKPSPMSAGRIIQNTLVIERGAVEVIAKDELVNIYVKDSGVLIQGRNMIVRVEFARANCSSSGPRYHVNVVRMEGDFVIGRGEVEDGTGKTSFVSKNIPEPCPAVYDEKDEQLPCQLTKSQGMQAEVIYDGNINRYAQRALPQFEPRLDNDDWCAWTPMPSPNGSGSIKQPPPVRSVSVIEPLPSPIRSASAIEPPQSQSRSVIVSALMDVGTPRAEAVSCNGRQMAPTNNFSELPVGTILNCIVLCKDGDTEKRMSSQITVSEGNGLQQFNVSCAHK